MTKYTITIDEDERDLVERALYDYAHQTKAGTPDHVQVTPLFERFRSLKTRTGIVDKENVDYYIAWTNTDRTEGRGSNIPEAISVCKSTALRLGKGRSVQGSDCHVTKGTAIRVAGEMYCPLTWARAKIVAPSKEDLAAEKLLAEKQAREEKRRQILEHARTLGLSDEDIALLTSKE